MRSVWLPETIKNMAEIGGWKVEWVTNITDVGHLVGDGDEGEDKIEKGAKRDGKTAQDVVNFYLDDYKKQVKALNIDLPKGKMNPKATEYIIEQAILSIDLLKNGQAYITNNGIYFDSQSEKNQAIRPDYLKKIESNIGSFTGRQIAGNETKHPEDFALWKFVESNTLQKWKIGQMDQISALLKDLDNKLKPSEIEKVLSSWGCPGWHSECVCMINGILGNNVKQIDIDNKYNKYFEKFNKKTIIDIHLGGEDHIDVHHKNEIWQSEALGFHLSQNWVHNKFLTVDSRKMSKSIGNVYLVVGNENKTGFPSIEEKGFSPIALRLMFMEHHYTETMDFTWDKLEQAQNRLFNLRKEAAKIKYKETKEKPDNDIFNDLFSLLTDNLNISKFLEKYQTILTNAAKNQNKEELEVLFYFEDNFLKLDLFPVIPNTIKDLAKARQEAKAKKEWDEADKLRDQIHQDGWQIDDNKNGNTFWQKI